VPQLEIETLDLSSRSEILDPDLETDPLSKYSKVGLGEAKKVVRSGVGEAKKVVLDTLGEATFFYESGLAGVTFFYETGSKLAPDPLSKYSKTGVLQCHFFGTFFARATFMDRGPTPRSEILDPRSGDRSSIKVL
jgi:hypothetical protein